MLHSGSPPLCAPLAGMGGVLRACLICGALALPPGLKLGSHIASSLPRTSVRKPCWSFEVPASQRGGLGALDIVLVRRLV